jgi:hypothetical protein
MPIPREQFEKDLSTEQAQYLQFLERNPDQAYTVEEICAELQVQLPPDSVSRVLYLWGQDYEFRKGLVDTKIIGTKTYYAIKQRPP